MADSGEDQGPLPPDQGHLDGHESEERSDYAGRVDDDVLLVGVFDGALAGGDVVAEQDDGEERASEIEGPVVTLIVSVISFKENLCGTWVNLPYRRLREG